MSVIVFRMSFNELPLAPCDPENIPCRNRLVAIGVNYYRLSAINLGRYLCTSGMISIPFECIVVNQYLGGLLSIKLYVGGILFSYFQLKESSYDTAIEQKRNALFTIDKMVSVPRTNQLCESNNKMWAGRTVTTGIPHHINHIYTFVYWL